MDMWQMPEAVQRPEDLPVLSLAYIGDAVYELYIRARLLAVLGAQAGKLHAQAKRYVSARAQSAIVKSVMDQLSEEELSVFRRGRNAKPPHVPKNADVGEYHHATGLEALVGYLYLKGERERLFELLALCFAQV